MFSSLKFAYQTGEALLQKGLSEEEMDHIKKMIMDETERIQAGPFIAER